jgi:hypothetical protein
MSKSDASLSFLPPAIALNMSLTHLAFARRRIDCEIVRAGRFARLQTASKKKVRHTIFQVFFGGGGALFEGRGVPACLRVTNRK